MTAVASQARSLGMGMVHKGEDHLLAVLPKEFMQLGMATHKDFDKIAADAESLKDPRHTLRQLSESMKKCSACHESYQIRVENLSGVAAGEIQSLHYHDYAIFDNYRCSWQARACASPFASPFIGRKKQKCPEKNNQDQSECHVDKTALILI
jgi:hypothetical protein